MMRVAAVLVVLGSTESCDSSRPRRQPAAVPIPDPMGSPRRPHARDPARAQLSLCSNDAAWRRTSAEAQLEAAERMLNAAGCLALSSPEDMNCRFRPPREDDPPQLVCHCPHPPSTPRDLEVAFPHELNASLERQGVAPLVFLLWRGDTSPLFFDIPAFARPSPLDFEAISQDLDGDAREETIVSLRGTPSTIGRVYMHRVVIDGRRPVATHIHAFAPDVAELRGIVSTGDASREDWDLTSARYQLVRRADASSACDFMTFRLSTAQNGCDGCTAGGPTSAAFRTFGYRNGQFYARDGGQLWSTTGP